MNLSNVVIITKRLRIVPTTEKYAKDIFQECTAEVVKYLSFDPSGKIEDTIKYIRLSQPKIKNGEEMPITVVDKTTEEFIGCGGLHKIKTDKPELGIWIKKSAQRRGYGKETIKALIKWAENNLSYKYLTYPVEKTNIPSRKLIESLGGILKAKRKYTSPTGKELDEVEYWFYRK